MSIGPLFTAAAAAESRNNAQRQQSIVNTQQNGGGSSASGGGVASGGAANAPAISEVTWKYLMQRIQQRKQEVCNFPVAQKLAKLSMYSACQAEGCGCTGWKKSPENRHKDVESSYCPNLSEGCSNISCRHSLESHIAHLDGISGSEMNKLLIAIIDMEKLYASMQRIDDEDTKKVYLHIVSLLRHCVLTRQPAVIRGHLGYPPFESPCISKAVLSFVFYKYSHLSRSELETMTGVARTFLNFLNYYKFQPPSMRRAALENVHASNYETNYRRWLVFCRLPTFYHSLRRFETKLIFGRALLTADFQNMADELKMKCIVERDMFPADKRSILTQMPTFLEALKEEVLKDDSPIWDQSYGPPNSSTLQQRKRQQNTVATASSGIASSSASKNGSGEPAPKQVKRENSERTSG